MVGQGLLLYLHSQGGGSGTITVPPQLGWWVGDYYCTSTARVEGRVGGDYYCTSTARVMGRGLLLYLHSQGDGSGTITVPPQPGWWVGDYYCTSTARVVGRGLLLYPHRQGDGSGTITVPLQTG